MREDFDIQEDMQAQRLRAVVKKYAIIGAVLAVLAFAIVGVWSTLSSQKTTQRQELTSAYLVHLQSLEHMLDDNQVPSQAQLEPQLKAFAQLSSSTDEGVSSLSRIYIGDVYSHENKPTQALQEWRHVADDPRADPLMRNMASFLWCQRQLDEGDVPTLRSHLLLLMGSNGMWKGPVTEALAILDLREGQQTKAREKLTQLLEMADISPGVRYRSQKLLQTLAP